MTRAARIAVVYYSATGNVHRLAHALAEGRDGEGAEVRVRLPAARRGLGRSALTQFLLCVLVAERANTPRPLESTMSQAVSFRGGVG